MRLLIQTLAWRESAAETDGYLKHLIIFRQERKIYFCHQSNYSGSVVQDRQALRKMYGLSDFVFTAITIYSPLLLQENIESVQNFQSTLFDRLLHNLKLHKHSYSGKGLFDSPLVLSSVT